MECFVQYFLGGSVKAILNYSANLKQKNNIQDFNLAMIMLFIEMSRLDDKIFKLKITLVIPVPQICSFACQATLIMDLISKLVVGLEPKPRFVKSFKSENIKIKILL